LYNQDERISDEAYLIIIELYQNLKLNYERKLSDDLLKQKVNELILKFDNLSYSEDSEEGKMVAVTLAISISSIEWWKQNPNAVGSNLKVAPWVAADVGGAIFGAVWGGVVGGSWKSAGIGALGGAIAGSTGIAGRIGKFLFK
jgi:hypothetical protein